MAAMRTDDFDDDGATALAEINVVPLVDVMLVLLVIFIITAPLLTHAVKVDLPQATSIPNDRKSATVQLAIDAAGTTYWNGEIVDRTDVQTRLAQSARLTPAPELHIRADRTTPYERVAEVLADAARAGLTRIGFVSTPEKNGP